MQLTPVFLPGKFHGQRSLAGYSPWGHKRSDKSERLNMHTQISSRALFFFLILVWAGSWKPAAQACGYKQSLLYPQPLPTGTSTMRYKPAGERTQIWVVLVFRVKE